MLTIAVDAMGGDHAPKSEVEGAIQAVKTLDVRVILVGLEDVVRRELAKHSQAAEPAHRSPPRQRVHHHGGLGGQGFQGQEGFLDSRGLAAGARWYRAGCGVGRQHRRGHGHRQDCARHDPRSGPSRARLGAAYASTGKRVVLLDVGANVDCKPEMLAQFAVMGEIYSRIIFHNASPRVGLLSIGEEEHKGNDLTRTALPLLKILPIKFHR